MTYIESIYLLILLFLLLYIICAHKGVVLSGEINVPVSICVTCLNISNRFCYIHATFPFTMNRDLFSISFWRSSVIYNYLSIFTYFYRLCAALLQWVCGSVAGHVNIAFLYLCMRMGALPSLWLSVVCWANKVLWRTKFAGSFLTVSANLGVGWKEHLLWRLGIAIV